MKKYPSRLLTSRRGNAEAQGHSSTPWLLVGLLLLTGLIGACATRLEAMDGGGQRLNAQQRLLLSPVNGGKRIGADGLLPGDIVLSAAMGINSLGIRLLTVSPVSHAALYLGDGQLAEAVGEGVRLRHVNEFLKDESTIVAMRHPGLTEAHASAIQAFVPTQIGKKYNTLGVLLLAPFTLQRQVCELPLVPSLVRDFCIRGIAAIQLGAAQNDRFFCSQFVLEAYARAGLPLTTANPLLMNPGDLLHMREGDVPSVNIHQSLIYVGHLKGGEPGPPPVARR